MDDQRSNRQTLGTILFLMAGPILWAGDFTVIYGAQSSLCAFAALDQGAIGMLVSLATGAFILADLAALRWPQPLFRFLAGAAPPASEWPFILGVMRGLAALSALAMLYFAFASLLLPACAQLR